MRRSSRRVLNAEELKGFCFLAVPVELELRVNRQFTSVPKKMRCEKWLKRLAISNQESTTYGPNG